MRNLTVAELKNNEVFTFDRFTEFTETFDKSKVEMWKMMFPENIYLQTSKGLNSFKKENVPTIKEGDIKSIKRFINWQTGNLKLSKEAELLEISVLYTFWNYEKYKVSDKQLLKLCDCPLFLDPFYLNLFAEGNYREWEVCNYILDWLKDDTFFENLYNNFTQLKTIKDEFIKIENNLPKLIGSKDQISYGEYLREEMFNNFFYNFKYYPFTSIDLALQYLDAAKIKLAKQWIDLALNHLEKIPFSSH